MKSKFMQDKLQKVEPKKETKTDKEIEKKFQSSFVRKHVVKEK